MGIGQLIATCEIAFNDMFGAQAGLAAAVCLITMLSFAAVFAIEHIASNFEGAEKPVTSVKPAFHDASARADRVTMRPCPVWLFPVPFLLASGGACAMARDIWLSLGWMAEDVVCYVVAFAIGTLSGSFFSMKITLDDAGVTKKMRFYLTFFVVYRDKFFVPWHEFYSVEYVQEGNSRRGAQPLFKLRAWQKTEKMERCILISRLSTNLKKGLALVVTHIDRHKFTSAARKRLTRMRLWPDEG